MFNPKYHLLILIVADQDIQMLNIRMEIDAIFQCKVQRITLVLEKKKMYVVN